MTANVARLSLWAPRALSLLRIVAGLLFLQHGMAKYFDFPHQATHRALVPFTQNFWSGTIELVGGVLLTLGLYTRPAAFIMCGEMAVAYFKAHAPRSFFPLLSGGEPAVLYCFVFLYIMVAGGGAWTLDRLRSRR